MDTELYRKGQARVDEANKQALSGQVGGALTKEGIISQNGVSPITSTTLTSTPEIKLPTTQPTSSIADGVIASTTASADQFQKEAERVIAEQNKGQQAIQQERETTLGKIKGLFGQTSDLQTQRAEAEKQVDPFRAELANINKEIADQNVALRGETDAIMARGDVSREGQQSLLQNVKDTYGRRLADLAIRQSAANQNVTALETALDRKLELATASIKNDIEYYKDFELANLDILSKEERQRVQDIVAEKERQMESVTKKETAIANILKEALTNGVNMPDNVVAQIQKAKSDLEAYAILAKNGISLAKAGTGGGGVLASLPTSIQGKIISQSEKFSGSDIVKKYNSTVDSINVINGISSASENPADHQTIVYAFAKALDPDSAVKEGEYETIKKYAQSMVSRYGKEITNAINGTGFLSEKAISDIKTTMNNNLKSRTPQYENLKNETARVIDNIAGSPVASEILKDFSAGIAPNEEVVKNQVNDFVKNNPDKFDIISSLYSDPSITDFDVVEYLKLQGLIK